MTARTALRAVLGIGLSVAACVALIALTDVTSAVRQVAGVQPGSLILPIGIVAAQFLIRAFRWSLLLSATASRRVSTSAVSGPLAVGYLANAVLPARLGEVVRILVVSRRTGVALTPATASVVVERPVDLIALLTVGATAAALAGIVGLGALAAVFVLLALLGVALLLAARLATPLARFGRVGRVLGNLAGDLGAVRAPLLLTAWFLSAASWLADGCMVWLCASALGVGLAPEAAVLIAVGAALGTAVPAGGGYIGTYELGALAFGSLAGIASEASLAVIVLAHAVAVLPLAVLGLVALAAMTFPATLPEPHVGPVKHVAEPGGGQAG